MATSGTTVLAVSGLAKRFQGIHVLRGIDLQIACGRTTALLGSNGAGKSTLLNLVSGLLAANEGSITLNGQEISTRMSFQRARAGIARTFQHPRSFQSLTAFDAVILALTGPKDEGILLNLLRVVSGGRDPAARLKERAMDILKHAGLEHRATEIAANLSYSEQKCLMLAQALAFDKDLSCFDELCAGLEPSHVARIGALFRALAARGKAVLFIEHNLELVREFADETIFLHEGRVHRHGPTASVLADSDVIKLYLGE
mgnify:CR=1 FL=1